MQEVGLEVLDCCDRVTALEFQKVSRTKEGFPYLLIDVRPQLETAICRLPVPSLNVPYEELDDRADHVRDAVRRNLPFSGDLLPSRHPPIAISISIAFCVSCLIPTLLF